MNAHERGVDQATRVLRGESLTVDKVMYRYGVSLATAKRDVGNLLWIIRGDTPIQRRRTIVAAPRARA